jgi:hypothetical protein
MSLKEWCEIVAARDVDGTEKTSRRELSAMRQKLADDIVETMTFAAPLANRAIDRIDDEGRAVVRRGDGAASGEIHLPLSVTFEQSKASLELAILYGTYAPLDREGIILRQALRHPYPVLRRAEGCEYVKKLMQRRTGSVRGPDRTVAV